MARTKKTRLVQMAPEIQGFKPTGISAGKADEALVTFAEYEALKLCDYEKLHQEEAAALMNVSRPTLTRIYRSAREKVARAFVEGRCIRFEEGKAELSLWHSCENCMVSFTLSADGEKACPLCKSTSVKSNCLHDEITDISHRG